MSMFVAKAGKDKLRKIAKKVQDATGVTEQNEARSSARKDAQNKASGIGMGGKTGGAAPQSRVSKIGSALAGSRDTAQKTRAAAKAAGVGETGQNVAALGGSIAAILKKRKQKRDKKEGV